MWINDINCKLLTRLINTASPTLLKNVSGLNAATANSIIAYREENGKIMSRKEMKKIPKIGPKAFQQAAKDCLPTY